MIRSGCLSGRFTAETLRKIADYIDDLENHEGKLMWVGPIKDIHKWPLK